jgi:carbamoyl-phosphate synthase large subunit
MTSPFKAAYQKGVLITSLSKKVPLIFQVREASKKVHAFTVIHGFDSNPDCIGKYFVDHFWECKPLNELSRRDILAYCKEHEIGAIIPTRDGELPFFARERLYFQDHGIQILIGSTECVDLCEDKFLFYEKLCYWGLPCIPTYLKFGEISSGKLVVKERYGTATHFTGVAENLQDAKHLSGKIAEPIYQPFISGQEYSIDLYRSREKRIFGPIVRQRNFIVHGESQISTTCIRPEIEQFCTHLAQKLDLFGHAVFQGIEQEDGEFLFLECNPRFGGASSLACAAGLETFTYFFKESLGQSVENEEFLRNSTPLRLIRYPKDQFIEWID